jgi:hypothetical protein
MDDEKHTPAEAVTDPAREVAHDRLMEERNILQLEGSLFCFDPREAKKPVDELVFREADDRPVRIVPHPRWGRPQGLAYKILQAIFLKIIEEGYPYPEQVGFTKRELARLIGWENFGGWQGRQFYDAVMQLHSTQIHCSFYNSETTEWKVTSFYVLPRVLFAGRGKEINSCVFYIDPLIVQSLRRKYVVFFNLQRLSALDPMGMVLYKRIFFYLSLLQHRKTPKHQLIVHKDYDAVCQEWLGGLKPEAYKSRIDKQLGKRFRDITKTTLTRSCGVEHRANGQGFKLVARPGKGFFEDYEEYYEKQQRQFQFSHAVSSRYIQQPMELVAYFHERLDHKHTRFEEHELQCASELLEGFSYADLRDFVEYAVAEAKRTSFEMKYFGAAKQYVRAWDADRERRAARERRQAAVKACPHCDETGHLILRNPEGSFTARLCAHDYRDIEVLEAEGLELV